ncbi:cytidine deaminase-like protein [Macrolepiota fuliginosa MF-IS2]|uniref:Cytidine deaminase-like protein n=1 Tax=Macrolepiota fuliginosa MF-IS2 TaxID=1400762 RepID=A0A9P5XPH1_9AGAR|nr:cytidine deaminase-like protein [Macrolepiota fuliginosa MF-IS2]
MTEPQEEHVRFLRLALDEARKCEPTPTAFCVGCVIAVKWPSTSSEPVVLSTGFSRELPGNTHAEANALAKARALTPDKLQSLFPAAPTDGLTAEIILTHSDIYTTLEPCSIRTSGLAPCSDAIIAAGIPRCYIGVGEPDDFVKCEGAQRLKQTGVEVIWLTDFEEECLRVARTGHESK